MTERPQPLIGITVIEAFLFFLVEPNPAQRIFRICGGTATWSEASTTSRSASPEPWAIQMPPQAVMMGMMAVARPLAGVMYSIP